MGAGVRSTAPSRRRAPHRGGRSAPSPTIFTAPVVTSPRASAREVAPETLVRRCPRRGRRAPRGRRPRAATTAARRRPAGRPVAWRARGGSDSGTGRSACHGATDPGRPLEQGDGGPGVVGALPGVADARAAAVRPMRSSAQDAARGPDERQRATRAADDARVRRLRRHGSTRGTVAVAPAATP